MPDDKLKKIRDAEKQSHIDMYSSTVLFEKGTWLEKPVKTMMEIIPFFEKYKRLRVLDLGSGIGRNSIPIAQKYKKIDCMIDCVDILDLAIEKLYEYSEFYEVKQQINGITMPLERFSISKEQYDFIMAISALEHIHNEEAFYEKLIEIKEGVSKNGFVCLIINSEIKEMNRVTGKQLTPQFEVNIATEKMEYILRKIFKEWAVLKFNISQQQYDIPREDSVINLETNVVTLAAQKIK